MYIWLFSNRNTCWMTVNFSIFLYFCIYSASNGANIGHRFNFTFCLHCNSFCKFLIKKSRHCVWYVCGATVFCCVEQRQTNNAYAWSHTYGASVRITYVLKTPWISLPHSTGPLLANIFICIWRQQHAGNVRNSISSQVPKCALCALEYCVENYSDRQSN